MVIDPYALPVRVRRSSVPFALVLILLGVTPAEAAPGGQVFKLKASAARPFDQLGSSVALNTARAFSGAIADAGGAPLNAPVSVFDVASRAEVLALTRTDLVPDDDIDFGYSVAANDTLALVGAPDDSDRGWLAGAAYLFDAVTGEQRFKLTANDGNAIQRFGHSVALDGPNALVGATSAGGAYLFDVTTGQQRLKLVGSDSNAGDWFGSSVALAGNVALIGSPYDDDHGNASGSAYLFDATSGQQLAKLTALDAALGDAFGSAVAIRGNTALIGAPFDDEGGVNLGAAYLVDVSTGQQLFKLAPTGGVAEDRFGSAVAIHGNLALVGSPYHDDPLSQSGAAYVFDIRNGQQIAKLTAPDTSLNSGFGWSVAVFGNNALVGAPFDREAGIIAGAAYLFIAVPEPTSVCLLASALISLAVRNRGAHERNTP